MAFWTRIPDSALEETSTRRTMRAVWPLPSPNETGSVAASEEFA